MHLRLLPPAPQPSILFTFSLPNLPPALPFPPAYAGQLQFLLTTELDPPPTPYVLDKAVWAIHLIDTVTFDLTGTNVRGANGPGVPTVEVNFIDGEVVTWEIQPGEHAMLDRVLEAVKMSTLEAQNEKMAELRKATAHYNNGPFNNGSSSVDHHHHEHDGTGHSRHQSMSGGRTSHKRSKSLFNSLLSALNLSSTSQQQPPLPPLPPLPNSPCSSNQQDASASIPSYIDAPYRIGGHGKRDSDFLEHLSELRTYQAVMQPQSLPRAISIWFPPSPYTYPPKDQLPSKTLTASRQLRRNARSTLVDCFRRWVVPRVRQHLRWGSFLVPDESHAVGMEMENVESAIEAVKWGKMSKATNAYADWACRSMIARCEIAIRSSVTPSADQENPADRTIAEKESRRSSATSTLASAFTASSRASSSHQEQEDRPHQSQPKGRPTSLQSHNSYASRSTSSTSKQASAFHGALARFHALHDTIAAEARGLAESHTIAMRMLEERGRRRGWSCSEGGGLMRKSPLQDAATASSTTDTASTANPSSGSKTLAASPNPARSPNSPSFSSSRTSPTALSFGFADGEFGGGYGYGTGWSIWEMSIPLVRSSLGEISSTYEDLLMEWEMEQEFGGFGSGDEDDSFRGIGDFDAENGIDNGGEDICESDGEYTCSPNQSSILLPDSSSHVLSLDDAGDVDEDSEGIQDVENMLLRSPTLGLGLGVPDHSEFSDSSSEEGDEDLDRDLLDALTSEPFNASTGSSPSPSSPSSTAATTSAPSVPIFSASTPAPTAAASSTSQTKVPKAKGHRSRKSGIQARLGIYEDVRDEVPPVPPLMAFSPPRPTRPTKSSMGPEDISNTSISSIDSTSFVESDEDKESGNAGGIGLSPRHPSKIEAALQNAQNLPRIPPTSHAQASRPPRSPKPANITVSPQSPAQSKGLSRSQSYHRREAAFYEDPLPNPILNSGNRDGASVDLWKSQELEHPEPKTHSQARASTYPHPTAGPGPNSSNLAGIGAGSYVGRARSRSGGLGILEQVGGARMSQSQDVEYPVEHGIDGVGVGYPPGLHGDIPPSPRSPLAPLSPRSSLSTLSPPSSPPPPSPPRRESYYIQRDLPREIPPSVPPLPNKPGVTLPPTPRLSYEKPIVVGRGRTPNVLKKTPKQKPKLTLAFPEPPSPNNTTAITTDNNPEAAMTPANNISNTSNLAGEAPTAKGLVNSQLSVVQRTERETPALLLDTPTVEYPSSTYPYTWELNVVPTGVVVVGTVGVLGDDPSSPVTSASSSKASALAKANINSPKKIKKVRPILCVTPPPHSTTFSLGRSKSFKSLPKLSSIMDGTNGSLNPNRDNSAAGSRPSLGPRRRSVEVLSMEPPSPPPPLPSPPLSSPSSATTTSPETPSSASMLSPCPSTPSLTHSLSYTSTSISACSVATITDSGEGDVDGDTTITDGPGTGFYDGIVMTPYSYVHPKVERRIAIVHQEMAETTHGSMPTASTTATSGRRHTRSRSKTDATSYFLLPPQLPPPNLPPPPRPSKSPKRSVSSCSIRKLAASSEGGEGLKSKSAENLPIAGTKA